MEKVCNENLTKAKNLCQSSIYLHLTKKKFKAIKNPQPCKEINIPFYHLDIYQGLIFSIGSLSE